MDGMTTTTGTATMRKKESVRSIPFYSKIVARCSFQELEGRKERERRRAAASSNIPFSFLLLFLSFLHFHPNFYLSRLNNSFNFGVSLHLPFCVGWKGEEDEEEENEDDDGRRETGAELS